MSVAGSQFLSLIMGIVLLLAGFGIIPLCLKSLHLVKFVRIILLFIGFGSIGWCGYGIYDYYAGEYEQAKLQKGWWILWENSCEPLPKYLTGKFKTPDDLINNYGCTIADDLTKESYSDIKCSKKFVMDDWKKLQKHEYTRSEFFKKFDCGSTRVDINSMLLHCDNDIIGKSDMTLVKSTSGCSDEMTMQMMNRAHATSKSKGLAGINYCV